MIFAITALLGMQVINLVFLILIACREDDEDDNRR